MTVTKLSWPSNTTSIHLKAILLYHLKVGPHSSSTFISQIEPFLTIKIKIMQNILLLEDSELQTVIGGGAYESGRAAGLAVRQAIIDAWDWATSW